MRRIVARELMDDPVESLAELEANLTDIEFANAVFGGTAPVLREVRRSGARTLLDVGCGSADIPLALVRDAQRRGVQLDVTALDRNEAMLAIARRRSGGHPRLHFVAADGAQLPFADGAFDVVTCNLALHHFEPDAARLLLREMRRVARVTPLVCDLLRSRTAYAAAYAWSRICTRNRLSRHDGPLSVRRAYTPPEAYEMAREAGWRAPRVRREPFFRMTLIERE
ncbi:MAG: class I SAM-dependent methyltransferase [Candidatus Velthaea sp.]